MSKTTSINDPGLDAADIQVFLFLSFQFTLQHFSILSAKIEEIDVSSWESPPHPNKLTCPSEPMCDCSLIAVGRLKEPIQSTAAPAASGLPVNIWNRITINKHLSNFPYE